MGTRSITVFTDSMFPGEEREVCVLYKQSDGYPPYWGQKLKEFFGGKKIKNGITNNDFNGMGHAAVCFIKNVSEKDIYLEPCKERNFGQNYTYFVSHVGEEIHLEIYESEDQIYDGTMNDFDPNAFD